MSKTYRLGIFIVSTMAMLVLAIFLIGDRQFLFASTYRVKTTFKTVAGLSEGAEVRIGGIHKGMVKHIDLPAQPTGEMTVLMDLDKSTRKVVRADSVASIATEGLLGNKFVDISFGSEGAAEIANGGSITGAPTLDISDLLKKTNDILDSTKGTMVEVQASAEHLKGITAKIDQGQGTIGALVNDKKVYTQLNDVSVQAKLGVTSFQENMEALKHNFFLKGFFNNRGYEDSTKLAQHLIEQLPREPALKIFRYDVKKIFSDVEHAKLKNQKTIDEAGRFLERTPFGTAVVVAVAGMKGDSGELETLLRARAMVVRDYLVKNFRMDDTRVKTMDVGKKPDTATDAGTVDIMIYPTSVEPPRKGGS